MPRSGSACSTLPLLTGAAASFYLAIAATGTIYISYLLCNWGVLRARRRGWPHQGAWFKLGSWGTIINILALVWGAAMVINIGLWEWEGRRLRQRAAEHLVEPADQHLPPVERRSAHRPARHSGVRVLRRLGHHLGVLYYVAEGQRGKEDVEQLAADEATETMIA